MTFDVNAERKRFEKFMYNMLLFSPEEMMFDATRNLYQDYRIRLAWSAWRAALQ